MQFKVKRQFNIQVTALKVRTYSPGVYDVPKDMPKDHAVKCARQRRGEWVKVETVKQAPENKVVETAESKAKVAKKTGYRRSTRTKSDA